ncbi:hypothetical protein Poli38472_002977 [Pythium oligandrum]|uniref:t-SNARE coiled-coil homology domain-containing protein n=1 Tax=Pythium oligandrum TaxID=41045 RepID=A0A8K1C5T2_PYTOL|nr:hypothetical protein Poli38472_002977 [Pythium oligandrum]|eukprot:TMW57052.1 hypothetical protein Poli38472_002977 [Pythium oligandrum]
MAHRDLTDKFYVRRTNLKKRNLRFRLRQLQENTPYLPLFQSKGQFKIKGMDKALLQESRELAGMEAGEIPRPEWIRFADEANEAVRLLHVKLEYLQLVHTKRLMIRFDDSEEAYEREIDQLNDEITALFHLADRLLKKITGPFVGGEPSASSADRRVRLSTQRAIATRLQDISLQFRQRQREYLHRLQLQKHGSDAFNFDPDAEPMDQERYESAQMALVTDMQTFDIKTRDTEIQRIARTVSSLAVIFKQVADMVITQGTLVDRIDYNMEQVATRMQSSLKEMRRAEQYQRNTRPQRCIFLLLTGIFLCFVVLLLKHS